MSNISLPFINSSVFVTEALTDAVQLEDHDGIPTSHINDPPEQASAICSWNFTVLLHLEASVRLTRRSTLPPGVPT